MNNTAVTQAKSAISALKQRLVQIEDDGRTFNAYDHVLVCHGCGEFHAVRSSFLSTPMSIRFDFADGSMLTIGGHGCPACMKNPAKPIRDAWENGVRPSTFNRAADAVGAIREPEPEAA